MSDIWIIAKESAVDDDMIWFELKELLDYIFADLPQVEQVNLCNIWILKGGMSDVRYVKMIRSKPISIRNMHVRTRRQRPTTLIV